MPGVDDDSSTPRTLPRVIGALLAVGLVLVPAAGARGAETAAQELAAKYSPVLSLEPQEMARIDALVA